MEEKIDQAEGEVAKTDQSPEGQSEETEEPITAERAFELAKGLQKGYTQTRQEISEIRDNIAQVVAALNSQSGATSGDDEYLTVAKAKEIFSEALASERNAKTAQEQQANDIIEGNLNSLRAEGIIKSKEDENSLIQYAVDIQETDLIKAARGWQKYNSAKSEGTKEVAGKKIRQEEGSKVGTSSKTTAEGEQDKGVDLLTVRRKGWFDFN